MAMKRNLFSLNWAVLFDDPGPSRLNDTTADLRGVPCLQIACTWGLISVTMRGLITTPSHGPGLSKSNFVAGAYDKPSDHKHDFSI